LHISSSLLFFLFFSRVAFFIAVLYRNKQSLWRVCQLKRSCCIIFNDPFV
jgi:hypothetical protein